MSAFAKLSAKQWGILVDLLAGETIYRDGQRARWLQPSVSRWQDITEAERVATIRACSALVRRGLIAREACRGTGMARFKLAISPRAVLNAVDDIEPASVSIDRVRRCVQCAELYEARERRSRAQTGRSRGRHASHPNFTPATVPNQSQLGAVAAALKMFALDDVAAGLKMFAREGSLALDDQVVAKCATWWPAAFVRQCLDQLRATGEYDRIVAEAQQGANATV